jgi:hypothetical protein
MTLLETLEYFLTETAADMDGLSWEIREETNFEDNNIEHLTECYDFNKELYDNLKKIKLMIGEKDPVKQILNDPNDELIEKVLKWTDKVLDGVDLNDKLPDEEND